MCGIAGIVDWSGQRPDIELLQHMLSIIRHRGPDECGLYVDHLAGIGCVRLSILDLETGRQPITNENQSLWIVFNGEIFNHLELRAELERVGHRFSTKTDTEVILHLYEQYGPACLSRLNGQFALAIWDTRRQELFLARDRVGICPLFVAFLAHGVVFGSEIKALLLHPSLTLRPDTQALAQAFTFWAPLAPRTAFAGVEQLLPGHYMLIRPDSRSIVAYWRLEFPPEGEEAKLCEEEAAEELLSLLTDATRIRLRADVEVGSYLSGGLDSTVVTALIRTATRRPLHTFSIGFEELAFDERSYQALAAEFLATEHHCIECTNNELSQLLPAVVWHAEAPLLRTAPLPMYALSELVHKSGLKVILTGEGADEFLGGYDIYKEDKIRRFWARDPHSSWRPILLKRLYPYIPGLACNYAYLKAFFGQELTAVNRVGGSHYIRWRNTGRLRRLFSSDLKRELGDYDPAAEFLAQLDGNIRQWSPLAQAQYLEVATFLSPYLLSAQGDRMLAAHSVEGRFPFLDHRVIEFCAQLPPYMKMRGLREKHILRKAASGLIPPQICERQKQPYRAPIRPIFLVQEPEYVGSLLSPAALRRIGLFDPEAVAGLIGKGRATAQMSETEEMGLVGVLSTQLLYHLMIETRYQQSSSISLATMNVCCE